MLPLAPAYLVAIATQTGALSAFMGGFAATFLAMFLTMGHRSRAASVAIAASAVASVAFIVSVVGSTMLIMVLHPDAPAGLAASAGEARIATSLSFTIGLGALLASIGASGWTRSRRAGWTTSLIAGAGFLMVALLVVN